MRLPLVLATSAVAMAKSKKVERCSRRVLFSQGVLVEKQHSWLLLLLLALLLLLLMLLLAQTLLLPILVCEKWSDESACATVTSLLASLRCCHARRCLQDMWALTCRPI
jgi:hypothetical protein